MGQNEWALNRACWLHGYIIYFCSFISKILLANTTI